MEPASIAAILISLIAAAGAYASNRATARAATMNQNTSSRVDMEKDAYVRARAMDTETIQRQDKEIKDLWADNEALRGEVITLREDNQRLRTEVQMLMDRIGRLERGLHDNLEQMLRDRLGE